MTTHETTAHEAQPEVNAVPEASATPEATAMPEASATPEARAMPEANAGPDGSLSDLRSRWADVQAAFVDDPRGCVKQADSLVADVVEELTSRFSQARGRLEEQWDRGEEVSTEDLRVTLTQYREFFERLLAV